MKKIPLKNSTLFALIDDCDYSKVSAYAWRLDDGWARTSINRKSVGMHRLIICKGEVVHHINENRLDNRRCNLNPMNRGAHYAHHCSGEKNAAKRPEVRRAMSAAAIGKHEGEKNYQHVLTEEQVREIRAKYVPRKYTLKRLAEEFGVCFTTIHWIISGGHWKVVS